MSCVTEELCNECKPFGRAKCIECKNLILHPICSYSEDSEDSEDNNDKDKEINDSKDKEIIDSTNMKFTIKKFRVENRSLVSIESDLEDESPKIEKDLYRAHKKMMSVLKNGNSIEKHEKEIIDFLETGCDGKDIYNYILKSAKEINKTENIHEENFIKRFEFLDSFFPLKDLDPYTYLRMISYGFEFKLLKFVDFVGSKNHNVWKKKFIKTHCGVLITDTKEPYCRLDFTTKNMKTLSSIKLFLSSMNESFLNISCFSNTKKYKIKMMNKAIKEKNISVQLEWKEMLKINWEEYKDKSFVKCNISSMMKDGDFIEKWNKHREALYRI